MTVSSGTNSGSFSLPLSLPSAWGTNQFGYQRTYKVIGSVISTNNTSHTAFEAVFNIGMSWSSGSNYYWKVSCGLIYINDSFVGTPSFDYGLNSSTTKQVATGVSNLTIALSSLNYGGGTTIVGRFQITEVTDSSW